MMFDFDSVLDDAESLIELQQPLICSGRRPHSSVADLFADEEFVVFMNERWPSYVQTANNLCSQNGSLTQESGKFRERAIIDLFSLYLGEDYNCCHVDVYSIKATQHGKDVCLFGRDVSIKTISASGRKTFNQLKISWVEDKAKAAAEAWYPVYDLLLCRLLWGSDQEGFYYISKEVQQSIYDELERQKVQQTKISNGYGKGTSLSKAFCDALVTHPQTLKLKINMPPEKRDDNLLPRIFDDQYRRSNAKNSSGDWTFWNCA